MSDTDFSIQPAAHEDAKNDARSAARWLIAAFAAVGVALFSGISFSSIGDVHGSDLVIAISACVIGIGCVLIAITLIADVLTPEPITLANLADEQRRHNTLSEEGTERGLIGYLEGEPSFLQGIDEDAPPKQSLIRASEAYEEALTARYRASKALWQTTREGDISSPAADRANAEFRAAKAQANTMHYTVRRLERVAAAQQTVLKLRARQRALVILAVVIAAAIGTFALIVGSAGPSSDNERSSHPSELRVSWSIR